MEGIHRSKDRSPITGAVEVEERAPEGKLSITYKGKTYKRWPVGKAPRDKGLLDEGESKEDYICHDCGTEWGYYHDLGCDMEQCPICKDQLGFCEHKVLFKDRGKKGFGKKGFGKEVVGTLKDVGSDFLVGLKKGFTPPGWKN